MATGNIHKKFGKVWLCGFRVMLADINTHSTLHPSWGEIIKYRARKRYFPADGSSMGISMVQPLGKCIRNGASDSFIAISDFGPLLVVSHGHYDNGFYFQHGDSWELLTD